MQGTTPPPIGSSPFPQGEGALMLRKLEPQATVGTNKALPRNLAERRNLKVLTRDLTGRRPRRLRVQMIMQRV